MPRSDEQDYRVFLGSEAFDPKEAAPQARRRAAAARRRRAARAARTDAPARDEAAPEPTIVQFERALNSADIERLRTDYGLGLERFLPNLAFLEALGSETLERLRQDFLVRETMPLDPTLKLAPGIGGDVTQFSAALLKEADPAVVDAGLVAVGATDVEIRDDRTAGGHLIARFTLDDQARLAEVADLEEVVWIEPVGEDTGDNTEASHTIQTATLDGHPIWDRGIHGEGQVIGVLDRGPPDQGHCFFAGPAPNTPGPGHRKLLAVRNASPPAPLQGHATFVAAIAAGRRPQPAGQQRPPRRGLGRAPGVRQPTRPEPAHLEHALQRTHAGPRGGRLHPQQQLAPQHQPGRASGAWRAVGVHRARLPGRQFHLQQ